MLTLDRHRFIFLHTGTYVHTYIQLPLSIIVISMSRINQSINHTTATAPVICRQRSVN